jgi:hypothetical protein
MVHLVRLADRMADALDFAVLPGVPHPSFEETLEEMPGNFRARFEDEPDELKTRIQEKIASWC